MNFKALEEFLDGYVASGRAAGVDCIVCQDHAQVFRHFVGMRDPDIGSPMKGNELYVAFSMTKMVTCTAALQLYEQGAYRLEDPVAKYLPEFGRVTLAGGGAPQKPITVWHLFTMGAGLNYDRETPGIRAALAAGKTTTRDLVEAMALRPLDFEPGSHFQYSLCHDVLGALIEVWSGKRLGEYMREHIFAPLGMKDTFFGVPKDEARLSRMMARYDGVQDGRPLRLPLEHDFQIGADYESGGAGLCTCVEDYAAFLDTLACGGTARNGYRLLAPETVKMMGTNQLQGQALADFDQLRPGYGYGLGVRVHMDSAKGGETSPIGEFGWDGAAGGFGMVDPQNRISLTYFQENHKWEVPMQLEMMKALYAKA